MVRRRSAVPEHPRAISSAAAGRTLAEVGERAWLRKLRRVLDAQVAAPGSQALLGIGDDAAVLGLRGGARGHDPRLVVTTDALIEDVHFRRATISMRDLGHKALAVNLSDLAAMGAVPVAAFLSLSLPGSTPVADLNALLRGLTEEGRQWACPLAGGDLTRAPQLCLTVTVFGRLRDVPGGRRRKGQPAGLAGALLRGSARPGDLLFVTGWPGESGAGLHALEHQLPAPPALLRRHRRPSPRLAESAALVRLALRHGRGAALDVSDGLWNDASQMAEASGVGLELHAAALPVSRALARYAHGQGRSPLDFVLFGGEDYELLTALPAMPKLAQWVAREWPRLAGPGAAPLHCIGRVLEGPPRVWLVDAAGHELPQTDATFRHF